MWPVRTSLHETIVPKMRCIYFLQIQLIRIELRVPEYGWTTQKVFHLMNFIVNGGTERNRSNTMSIFQFIRLIIKLLVAVRAVVFGFHKNVFLLHPKVRFTLLTVYYFTLKVALSPFNSSLFIFCLNLFTLVGF